MINPNKNANKNIRSLESNGVSIPNGTKFKFLSSATSGLTLANQPLKTVDRSSTFDFDYISLPSSLDKDNKKLHPITQIDYQDPAHLKQDLSSPRNSYKFFKYRKTQNFDFCGGKVKSSSSLVDDKNSNLIMVSPPKSAPNVPNVGAKDYVTAHKSYPELYSWKNTQKTKCTSTNHNIDYQPDNGNMVNGQTHDDLPSNHNGKSSTNRDVHCLTESSVDSCASGNESSTSQTALISSNQNRKPCKSPSLALLERLSADADEDRIGKKSRNVTQNKKPKSVVKNQDSACNKAKKSLSQIGNKKLANSKCKKQKQIVDQKSNQKRPKNNVSRSKKSYKKSPGHDSETDGRPQRNVHSVYSKATLQEKNAKIKAIKAKRKRTVKSPTEKSVNSLTVSVNKMEHQPIQSGQTLLFQSNSMTIPVSLSQTVPNANIATNAQSVQNHNPCDHGLVNPQLISCQNLNAQSGAISMPHIFPNAPINCHKNYTGNSKTLNNDLPLILMNQNLNSNNQVNFHPQTPIPQQHRLSGPFIRVIRNNHPSEPSVFVQSQVQSPGSDIQHIEEREKSRTFLLNKPEEVDPPPSFSEGNVGVSQCPDGSFKQFIKQYEKQQHTQLLNTMSQRLKQVKQNMRLNVYDIKQWACIFCHLPQNHEQLGTLFGPYIVDFLSNGNLSEIWFHEDCYFWAMLPLITPVKPLNSMAIEAINNYRSIICAKCGLTGATIECVVKPCNALNLHYTCALQWDYYFDQSTFKVFCPDHYKEMVEKVGPSTAN